VSGSRGRRKGAAQQHDSTRPSSVATQPLPAMWVRTGFDRVTKSAGPLIGIARRPDPRRSPHIHLPDLIGREQLLRLPA